MRRFFFLGFGIVFSIDCFAGSIAPPVSKNDAVTRATITYAAGIGVRQRVELPASNTGTGVHDFYSLFAIWRFVGDAVYGIGIATDKKLFYKDTVVSADGMGPLKVETRQQLAAGWGNKVNYLETTFPREALERVADTGMKLRLRSSKGSVEFSIPGWMFSALIEASDAKDYQRQAHAMEAKREKERKEARDRFFKEREEARELVKKEKNAAREAYLKGHPELPDRIRNAISEEKIVLGMSSEDARASWGAPSSINKTVNLHGVSEQWVYGDNYLYFDNGKLTSWQSSE